MNEIKENEIDNNNEDAEIFLQTINLDLNHYSEKLQNLENNLFNSKSNNIAKSSLLQEFASLSTINSLVDNTKSHFQKLSVE